MEGEPRDKTALRPKKGSAPFSVSGIQDSTNAHRKGRAPALGGWKSGSSQRTDGWKNRQHMMYGTKPPVVSSDHHLRVLDDKLARSFGVVVALAAATYHDSVLVALLS